MTPVYHVAGQNILEQSAGSPAASTYLTNAAHAKVEVKLNDKLVAATLLDDLAELKNDFPARAELAAEVGRALADRQDRLIAQAIAMAALGRRDGAARTPPSTRMSLPRVALSPLITKRLSALVAVLSWMRSLKLALSSTQRMCRKKNATLPCTRITSICWLATPMC